MLFSRLRSYFWPSPATLTLVWAALFVFTILFGIAGVYSLSTGEYGDGLVLVDGDGYIVIGILPAAVILAAADSFYMEVEYG